MIIQKKLILLMLLCLSLTGYIASVYSKAGIISSKSQKSHSISQQQGRALEKRLQDTSGTYASVLFYDHDTCEYCQGWVMIADEDTIVSNSSIIADKIPYEITTPIPVYITLRKRLGSCLNKKKFKYVEVLRISLKYSLSRTTVYRILNNSDHESWKICLQIDDKNVCTTYSSLNMSSAKNITNKVVRGIRSFSCFGGSTVAFQTTNKFFYISNENESGSIKLKFSISESSNGVVNLLPNGISINQNPYCHAEYDDDFIEYLVRLLEAVQFSGI